MVRQFLIFLILARQSTSVDSLESHIMTDEEERKDQSQISDFQRDESFTEMPFDEFSQNSKTENLISSLVNKIRETMVLEKNEQLGNFLSNFEILVKGHMKSNSKQYSNIIKKSDKFLVYLLIHMIDEAYIKCELLDAIIRSNYTSFKELKTSTIISLDKSPIRLKNDDELKDHLEMVMKITWIIIDKFVHKMKISTRPKKMGKVKNSIYQEINNYISSNDCIDSHKEFLEKNVCFNEKIVNILIELKIIGFWNDKSILYNDAII